VPLLIVSCALCDGPDGLPTGNGSAGITVAESASAAATIAADFIARARVVAIAFIPPRPYHPLPALREI